MNTAKKILEYLKAMPEPEQNEVLDFIEHLKKSANRRKQEEEDSTWDQFTLESAMRGIAEEPSPYGIEDIQERFR
ncbi:MAG: hypothetical protein A2Z08_01455 [Deltaproteobacteria bacterium RBG_16_54_11]|nr:MAG: hypothetical protein A2Z08_01455 [Deltaproteobacteria bacterium RBG_16_54_11]